MNQHPDLILGLDAGTSVVKAALFDRGGRELAVVRRPTPLYSPQPSWSETSMEATWAMAADAIRALLALGIAGRPLDPGRIAAVGLTGNMVGAWLIDEGGAPVRDAILWNDGRAQELIDQLAHAHPGFMQTIFRTSGSVMQQGCTLPVLRWLADHEPHALNRAATVLCCKDWLAYKLTGSRQVDPTEASVMPGSAAGRGYSEEMIDLFGLRPWRHLFPAVRASQSRAGELNAAAAEATGLLAGTPVVVGAGDVPASAIGLGAVEPGVACTLLGTNILNCLVTASPIYDPYDVGVMFCLPEQRWLRAMINVSGTTSMDWFIAQFCAEEVAASRGVQSDLFARLEALAQASSTGANGVLYLPYLSLQGITAPFWEPSARAEFFGLSDRTTRGDLLRALYEGIALSIRDGYAILPQAVSEIRLSGGGAKSAFWSQIIADCTGCHVVVPPGTEFGARGAALLAGVGLGWYSGVAAAVAETSHGQGEAEGAVPSSRTFLPAPEKTAIYDRLYAVYCALQRDLLPAWRLAAGR
ncbi:MAG: FGGY-family carbohydrate kinase [Caldilineaceae bacterium]